jgi:hypothetical protein
LQRSQDKVFKENWKSSQSFSFPKKKIFRLETLKEWPLKAEKTFSTKAPSLRETLLDDAQISIDDLYRKHFSCEGCVGENISGEGGPQAALRRNQQFRNRWAYIILG